MGFRASAEPVCMGALTHSGGQSINTSLTILQFDTIRELKQGMARGGNNGIAGFVVPKDGFYDFLFTFLWSDVGVGDPVENKAVRFAVDGAATSAGAYTSTTSPDGPHAGVANGGQLHMRRRLLKGQVVEVWGIVGGGINRNIQKNDRLSPEFTVVKISD